MKQTTKTFSSFLTLPLVVCGVLLSLSQPARSANLTSPTPADLVVQGDPFTTINRCGNSSISDIRVISKRPQLQVGQTFFVILTVAAVNLCQTSTGYQYLGINLKLPAGVEVDPIPELSSCLVFRATDPSDSNLRSCHRSSAGNGYERIDPNGAQQWNVSPSGRNAVQIQLAVRSRTTGAKQFAGRICDAMGDVVCEGDAPTPVANAIPFVSVTVGAAPVLNFGQGNGLVGTGAWSSTATTMTIRTTFLYTTISGNWRVQIRADGAPQFNILNSGERRQDRNVALYRSDPTGLSPSTIYEFRFCFTPTFGNEVCTPIARAGTTAR